MGGAAKTPSGRQRPGQAAAVGQMLGDVAGARPGHPSEPAGIVYDQTSDEVSLDEVAAFYLFTQYRRRTISSALQL
jgi:hypothetical protein